jgi:hypothetical protein
MNLFVAKLNFSTSSEGLREAFEQYGEVSSANVVTDRETGRSKGYGFVEMPNDLEVSAALYVFYNAGAYMLHGKYRRVYLPCTRFIVICLTESQRTKPSHHFCTSVGISVGYQRRQRKLTHKTLASFLH